LALSTVVKISIVFKIKVNYSRADLKLKEFVVLIMKKDRCK
jgi:hypothetical protein